jgi:hypothetical protein
MFRKLDLCPPSCEKDEALTLLGPLERAKLDYWTTVQVNGETTTLLGPLKGANIQ